MMHDISHCEGTDCVLKDNCYRYKAHLEVVEKDLKYMTYFTESPNKSDSECDYQIKL